MDTQRKHASAAEANLADDISATIVLLVMGEAGVSATSFLASIPGRVFAFITVIKAKTRPGIETTSFPNNFFWGGGA